jgi:hypothetical protein
MGLEQATAPIAPDAARASGASGQRGDSIVRAPDTRPETGSSARVDFEAGRLRAFVQDLGDDELERRSGVTKLSEIARALDANPRAVLFDSAGGHPVVGNKPNAWPCRHRR